MTNSEKRSHSHDSHVDLVLDWLLRASIEKEKQKNEDPSTLSWGTIQQLNKTTWLLGIFQVVLIILFATLGGSEILDPASALGTGTQGYNMFIGVEIMMFVGFGYLMTFLKWYGLGAVGLTMMVTAVGLQWSVFTESFFKQLLNNTHNWVYVDINIYSLLNALYAISAVLISFGALIGKITPLQLLSMTIIELVMHSVNFQILMLGVLKLTDLGGTYIDHMFGAYFGLAVSLMLGKPSSEPEMGNSPDIFSLIGTLFLWIYWPSFVAGAAVADSDQQQRAIVNTILALSASTIAAFWMSSFLSSNKRFRPVDIQNATLAGGVAIGCTANLALSPFGAIMIGSTAGLVSTFGYHHIQPYLEESILFFGMTAFIIFIYLFIELPYTDYPSVVGALASVIIGAYQQSVNHSAGIYGESFQGIWWRQLAGIVLCISFAVTTGMLTGLLLVYIGSEDKKTTSASKSIAILLCGKDEEIEGLEAVRPHSPKTSPVVQTLGDKQFEYRAFHDDSWWEVADDYGRSLYSELTLLINDREDKHKIKELISNKISDWSSHNGRRNKKSFSDFSGHGSLSRNASGGLFFSSHGDNKDKDKEKEKEKEKERDYFGGSGSKSPTAGLDVGYRVKDVRKAGGGGGGGLSMIEERDLEGQDFVPPTSSV